jgi:hypothetical protein
VPSLLTIVPIYMVRPICKMKMQGLARLVYCLGLLIFTFYVAGCYFPPPSSGGYATYDLVRLRYAALDPRTLNNPYVQQYASLTKKLFILQKSQVQYCYPARMHEMNLLALQIAQEIEATLFLSAKYDIDLLENNVVSLWPYREVGGCPRLGFNHHWHRLLSRIQ